MSRSGIAAATLVVTSAFAAGAMTLSAVPGPRNPAPASLAAQTTAPSFSSRPNPRVQEVTIRLLLLEGRLQALVQQRYQASLLASRTATAAAGTTIESLVPTTAPSTVVPVAGRSIAPVATPGPPSTSAPIFAAPAGPPPAPVVLAPPITPPAPVIPPAPAATPATTTQVPTPATRAVTTKAPTTHTATGASGCVAAPNSAVTPNDTQCTDHRPGQDKQDD